MMYHAMIAIMRYHVCDDGGTAADDGDLDNV